MQSCDETEQLFDSGNLQFTTLKVPPHIKNAINTNVTLMREDPQTFIQSIRTICQNMSLTKSYDNCWQNNKFDHQKSLTLKNKTYSNNLEIDS